MFFQYVIYTHIYTYRKNILTPVRTACMAVGSGVSVGSEVGKYNGQITPFVVLSCMVAATGGIIFGYDIGISGFQTTTHSS